MKKKNSRFKNLFTSRYSVMLIPESQKKVIQFQVKSGIMIAGILFFLCILLGTGIYVWITAVQVDKLQEIVAQDSLVKEEQDKLNVRLDETQQYMEQTIETYQKLFQKENELREALGMDLLQKSEFSLLNGEDLSTEDGKLAYMDAAESYLSDKLVILTANQKTISQRTDEKIQAEMEYIPKGFPLDTMSRILYSFGTADESGNIHQGFGLEAYEQAKVMASANGTVSEAGDYGDAQKIIKMDHGNGYISIYIFSGRILVNAGDVVTKGTGIGSVESSPDAALQLEFQVLYQGQYIDPEALLQISG